jgi:Fungal N-terminal domain of STAND proteins
LKKNPESAPDYQHLLIELEALDRALKQLLRIQPVHHELQRLEGIRALTTACQRPLEEFLAKIEKFEEHLGSLRLKGNRLSAFGRRLQWSMEYKDDVKDLRAKLAPNVATITVLLMTQTIDTLAKAESDRLQIARQLKRKLSFQGTSLTDLKQIAVNIATAQARLKAGETHSAAGYAAQAQEFSSLQSKADELLKDGAANELHLRNQDGILTDTQGHVIGIDTQTREIHALATAIHQDVGETQATSRSVLGLALEIMGAVTAGISKMQKITELIASMMRLTIQFTVEMRETMGRLLQAFWDTQIQLARLERFLPKQIDLPVVRFRDAFNEMRLLPSDLSRQWQVSMKPPEL